MPKVEIEEVKIGDTVVASSEAPKPEPIEEGKVAIIIDGKQVVFDKGQMDLPGMPDVSRLRKLADLFIRHSLEEATLKDRQDKVRQEVMLELKNEGRSGFAVRENGVTYVFEINAPQEKLEVKKKR